MKIIQFPSVLGVVIFVFLLITILGGTTHGDQESADQKILKQFGMDLVKIIRILHLPVMLRKQRLDLMLI